MTKITAIPTFGQGKGASIYEVRTKGGRMVTKSAKIADKQFIFCRQRRGRKIQNDVYIIHGSPLKQLHVFCRQRGAGVGGQKIQNYVDIIYEYGSPLKSN